MYFYFRVIIFAVVLAVTTQVSAQDGQSSLGNKPAVSNVDYQKDDPKALVLYLANSALGIINCPSVSASQVISYFLDLVQQCFAMKHIAKFALGRSNKKIDEQQREKFSDAFLHMLVKFYSSKFSEYRTAKFRVTKVIDAENGRFIVKSELAINESVTKVDWSVYVINGIAKIFDVIIDGVSMSQVQRAGIDGSIQHQGLKKFLDDFIRDNAGVSPVTSDKNNK